MSRTRYEPVPHRDPEEFSLSSLSLDPSFQHSNLAHPVPNYNYNSGVPTSVPSSVAPSVVGPPEYRGPYGAPSIRSIPTSPPPSFHTTSRAGTPRQSLRRESIGIRGGDGAIRGDRDRGDGESLWGVATSTGGAMTDAGHATEVCAAAEALETIKVLSDRVKMLEESIGRLLLEAEEREDGGNGSERHNCCVTFTDATPDLERVLVRGSNNCCVSFRGVNRRDSHRQSILAVLGVVALVCAGVVVVLLGKKTQVSVGEIPRSTTNIYV